MMALNDVDNTQEKTVLNARRDRIRFLGEVVAIIPQEEARIKQKNIRDFCGRPIINGRFKD